MNQRTLIQAIFRPLTLELFFVSLISLVFTGCGGGDAPSPVKTGQSIPENVVENNNTQDTTSKNPSENNNTQVDTNDNTFPVKDAKLPWEHGNLKANKNMLVHEDGTGFFWMADTAWNLYTITKKDIDDYLDDRAKKKYTVIQIVAMHSYWSDTNHADEEKTHPFSGNNIATPNEEYWKYIDYIVSKAEEKGMYIAMLPAWNYTLKFGEFKTTKGASTYGRWIANRYKDNKNIIWVIGGDTYIDGSRAGDEVDEAQEKAIWNAMANAIDKVDSDHLITFHPLRKIPSVVFDKPSWLDFNMLQSGRDPIATSITAVKEALKEGLAVVDGESLYENFGLKERGGEADRSTAFQVRNDAYSQVFVGAFGNTYGHDSIYRFYDKKEEADCSNWACTPNMTWKEALNAKGGTQMQYLTELMQSRPLTGRVADQELLQGSPDVIDGIVATKGDGYAMIYSAYGEAFSVKMTTFLGETVKAWWYNPRDGKSRFIEEFPNTGTQEFIPPAGTEKKIDKYGIVREGNDWVLVLDNASKGFGAPGK